MGTIMLRKAVAGTATEFKFSVRSCVFLVKNLTKGNVFVSFGMNAASKEQMILVPPGAWERHVCLNDAGSLVSYDTVYVTGSGEPADGVEVQCLKW